LKLHDVYGVYPLFVISHDDFANPKAAVALQTAVQSRRLLKSRFRRGVSKGAPGSDEAAGWILFKT
jgi:hypothetical protein